jgi:glutamine synthetase
MSYTVDEVMQYIAEEDVKFIRLAFCDIFGKPMNISVMPTQLERAFNYGISFDASAVRGFGAESNSDLLLHPDPSTLALFPWRPEHGRVVRMYCTITYPDGSPFELDTRSLLAAADSEAKAEGYNFKFGTKYEFYLFKTDENGEPTRDPYDRAGYMDIAPEDKGENVRREICLTLEQMGITPESSNHEAGPGQNTIAFRYSDPLTAADNAITFKSVVRTIAARSGLYAEFSPKPLDDAPGNALHVNISAAAADGRDLIPGLIAGILNRVSELTAFFNPSDESYQRLGKMKAPGYISWSHGNRSQLIRVPAAVGGNRRIELRSPDPLANPYLIFRLLINACLEGIGGFIQLPEPVNIDFAQCGQAEAYGLKPLPATYPDAVNLALASDFVRAHLPKRLIGAFFGKQ